MYIFLIILGLPSTVYFFITYVLGNIVILIIKGIFLFPSSITQSPLPFYYSNPSPMQHAVAGGWYTENGRCPLLDRSYCNNATTGNWWDNNIFIVNVYGNNIIIVSETYAAFIPVKELHKHTPFVYKYYVILSEMYLFKRGFLNKYKYKYKYLKKCRYLPIQITDNIYWGITNIYIYVYICI